MMMMMMMIRGGGRVVYYTHTNENTSGSPRVNPRPGRRFAVCVCVEFVVKRYIIYFPRAVNLSYYLRLALSVLFHRN